MSALAFSEKIGVTSSIAAKWVRENSAIKLSNLLKIAFFFNCSVDFICGRTLNQGKFNPAAPTFPERIDALVKLNGKPRIDIFKNIDINYRALYDWRKGSVPLSTQLITIADYFDVTIDYLIGIEEL